jgi:hypothetical protein
VDYSLEGLITGGQAPPADAAADKIVSLRVAAANEDGSHLQLEWQ